METSTSEKINLLLKRQNMTLSELADATGQSVQNLGNKMKRNNFKESELKKIAEALKCDLLIDFKRKADT
jgi:transcriptional regulator with XRE-family HTH domain